MKSVASQDKEAEKPEIGEKDDNTLDPLEKYKKLSGLHSKENHVFLTFQMIIEILR